MDSISRTIDFQNKSPADQIDSLLSHFESALANGESPEIDEYLKSVPDKLRGDAIALLVEIEVEFRLDRMEHVTPAEYCERFSSYTEQIKVAFTQLTTDRDGLEPRFRIRPGLKQDQFRIGEELGRGGVAVVYRAYDETLDRSLAIKTLLPEILNESTSKTAFRRLRQEAAITARLSHPGVPPVHAVGDLPDGRPYFCMRLIEGQTFAHILSSQPAQRMDHLQIVGRVAQILSSAHKSGIIHRDLKPSNIMVGVYGEVQLMDWGMAKRLAGQDSHAQLQSQQLPASEDPHEKDKAESNDRDVAAPNNEDERTIEFAYGTSVELQSDVTSQRTILGTLAYMPPEQALGWTEEHDSRSDVFALGAILCRVLIGRPPYIGRTQNELWKQAKSADLRATFAAIDKLETDSELVELTKKCLASEPDDRPSNASEVSDALQAYIQSIDERLKQAELERAEAQARAEEQAVRAGVESSRRKILVWLVAAVALSLLVGVGAAAFIRQQRLASQRLLDQQSAQSDRARARALTQALLNAPPQAFPYALQSLRSESLAPLAITYLKDALKDTSLSNEHRLHAVMALTQLGNPNVDAIVNSIRTCHPDHCGNILTSLQVQDAAEQIATPLRREIAAAESESDWGGKARLCIIARHLELPNPLTEMADRTKDPIQRTALVHTLPNWHDDLTELFDLTGADQPHVQAALVKGISLLPSQEVQDSSELQRHIESLFHSADSEVHAATSYLLRKWKRELPVAKSDPDLVRQWRVDHFGMTLIAVGPGTFWRTTSVNDENTQKVNLTKRIWIADREVSVALFKMFLEGDGPENSEAQLKELSQLQGSLPITNITFGDSLRFCNWLSEQAKLSPCYTTSDNGWQINADANGYRLPTEAEWEFAARGGTQSEYSFGDDRTLLDSYCVYSRQSPSSGASKLPNPFGLFDVHGNVWERCQDYRLKDYGTETTVTDPQGPSRGPTRVVRGGGFSHQGAALKTGFRFSSSDNSRRDDLGFRVVRND